MGWSPLLFFLLFFGANHAYNANNMDSKSAIYLEDPEGSENNLFGHSVAIHTSILSFQRFGSNVTEQ